MSEPVATERMSAPAGGVAVLVAVVFGALVAVGLGAFGKVHEPQFFSVSVAGFSSGTSVKSVVGDAGSWRWRCSNWCRRSRCTG